MVIFPRPFWQAALRRKQPLGNVRNGAAAVMFDYALRGELLIAHHDRAPFAKAELWSPIRVPFDS